MKLGGGGGEGVHWRVTERKGPLGKLWPRGAKSES